jgi:anti-sigma factor (TIGR02949 family)
VAFVVSDLSPSCRDTLLCLDEYVDRSLSPEELERVEAHLAACLQCAEKFQFEAGLVPGIRSRLQRRSLPPDLLRAIRLRLRRDRARGTFPGNRTF